MSFLRVFSIIFITTALVGAMVDGFLLAPGGLTEKKLANPQVQEIIDIIKPQLEAKLHRSLPQLKLLSYKTQVVAGINYFAKVDIGGEDVIHLKIYQDFGKKTTLTNYQYPKDQSEPILQF